MIINYQKKNMSKQEEMEAELKKTMKTNAEKTEGDKK